jgi:hypothetical protein
LGLKLAYQVHLPIQVQTAANGELSSLYAERDRLLARWNKGLDVLGGLHDRTGQDTPEVARYFAVWEEIDADLRRVLDRIDLAEMTERIKLSERNHLAIGRGTTHTPKGG